MADYFSFEDVLKELELSEEDLKRMVSEGELRAFRDQNKMKFKKEDVDNLKKGRITEPTIILPSTPGGGNQDETVLDLDIGQETAELKAAEEMGNNDDLVVQQDPSGLNIEETMIDEENDSGLTTEPLKLADEVETAETVESEAVTEEITEEEKPARRSQMTRSSRRSQMVPVATEEELERRRPHPVWTIFMIAAFVLGAYSTLFVYDTMRLTGPNGSGEQPMGMTAGLGKWFLGQFWGDKNWKAFHEKKYPQEKGAPPYDVPSDKPQYEIKHRAYNGPTFDEPNVPKAPTQ